MAERIIDGLIWSIGGLIVGYVLCWFLTESALRAAMEEQKVVDIRGYRVDIFKSILGICILALLVLSSIRYYQATSCQTRYNIAVHDSLKQRSDAQRDEADAQIKLLTANTHGDPVLGRIAITEYVDAIRKLEQVRSENPLPDNPNCGAF